MDWIPALLKHLGIARSVIGAVFITSAVLYFGSQIFPTYIPPVPKGWFPVLVIALVFCACLLIFWSCSAAWVLAKRGWTATYVFFSSFWLNQLERAVLLGMGQNPSEPFNLEHIDYKKMQHSRLEFVELLHGLEKKGLVHLNPYNSDLATLTPAGRQSALKFQREIVKNAK